MPKLQYGRGLSSILKEGMFLSVIQSEIRDLKNPIDQSLMLHNLYESSSLEKKWIENAINENLKNLRETLSPRIKRINEHINIANKLIKGLDFKHEIPTISISEVMSIVRNRLKTLFDVEDAQNMSNSHFQMSLGQILQKQMTAIQNFIEVVEKERYKEETITIGEPYKQGIIQALDICSVGYYSTSVFIAGKTIEEIINDIFLELFRMKKTKIFDIRTEKFKNKIGNLHGNKIINEELYHRLSNVRIDRNEFGHPSKKILSKKQAHLRIRLIAELMPDLEKTLMKLQKK